MLIFDVLYVKTMITVWNCSVQHETDPLWMRHVFLLAKCIWGDRLQLSLHDAFETTPFTWADRVQLSWHNAEIQSLCAQKAVCGCWPYWPTPQVSSWIICTAFVTLHGLRMHWPHSIWPKVPVQPSSSITALSDDTDKPCHWCALQSQHMCPVQVQRSDRHNNNPSISSGQ